MIIILCRISLIGFPFIRGFYSKDLILEVLYTINFNVFYLRIIIVSILFTVLYSLRVSYYLIVKGGRRPSLIQREVWNFEINLPII